jgi:hypothetical protein
MFGRHLGSLLCKTYGFQGFVDGVCYAMALSSCGVSLSDAELLVCIPVFWVQLFVDPFMYNFF